MKKRYLIALLALILLSSIPAITFAGSWNGWIYQDPYPTSVNLFDVKFITPLKGWITGKYGTILYTEDGGDTWEAQESGTEEDMMRVFFVNEKTGWAVGERGTIIHTEDGGKTWVKQYNINALPTKIFFLNEKEGWVTGATPMGVVYHTKDSGKTWQKVDTGINRAIGSVYFLNFQTGWILAGEEVYRTADGGNTWEKSKLPVSVPSTGPRPLGRFPGDVSMGEGLGSEWWYGDITFANEKQGWAAVFHWIFHTDDGGKTWAVQRDTGNLSVGHISFRDAQNGCVSGATIYCTEDEGKTWQERLGLSPGDNKELGGISLTDRSDGWVVGNGGRIMKTGDRGRSWKNISRGLDKCGGAPFFVNGKTMLSYGGRSTYFCRTDDGGQSWMRYEVGIIITDMFFIDDFNGWAVGTIEEWKNGKADSYSGNLINVWGVIKHTINGGKTWVIQHKELMDKKYYLGLVGVSFINHNIGWVVGYQGIILHTADGGKHWAHQKGGDTNFYLTSINFISAKIGWITGMKVAEGWTGIILHTTDGGRHWKIQNKMEGVFLCCSSFINKNSGWVTGHTEYNEVGWLLHTENGGKAWTETSFANSPLGPIIFLDGHKGVISSQEGIVIITTNGGKTWTKVRTPLKKHPWHISEIFERAINGTK